MLPKSWSQVGAVGGGGQDHRILQDGKTSNKDVCGCTHHIFKLIRVIFIVIIMIIIFFFFFFYFIIVIIIIIIIRFRFRV